MNVLEHAALLHTAVRKTLANNLRGGVSSQHPHLLTLVKLKRSHVIFSRV